MAKSNRATRKQLEEVIQKIIEELGMVKKTIIAIDNYLGAYVKFKGDTLMFHDFLQKEIEKMQEEQPKKSEAEKKDIESVKKSRYKKIVTPPLYWNQKIT